MNIPFDICGGARRVRCLAAGGVVNRSRWVALAALLMASMLMRLPEAPAQAAESSDESGLTVTDGDGRPLFGIKRTDHGAKLVDATDRELARLEAHGDRVKITDANNAVVGGVTGGAKKLHVKAGDKDLLFVLERQGDGDYKLVDAHEGLVAKLKMKGTDHVRVEDSTGKTLFKVKHKGDKVVLFDPTDAPALIARGAKSLLAFAAFGLDRLNRPQQAAVFYRLEALKVP